MLREASVPDTMREKNRDFLTNHQEYRAGLWVCQCRHCRPTRHCGVVDRLEIQDTSGVKGIPISHDGGVVQAAVHSHTITGPTDSWYWEPSRCYTLELHLLVLHHCHVPSGDADCTALWEIEAETEQRASQEYSMFLGFWTNSQLCHRVMNTCSLSFFALVIYVNIGRWLQKQF